MLPTPTDSIFIISSFTLNRSPPNIDVIPLNFIRSSVVNISLARVVVTAVDTIGDWTILSKQSRTLAFAFVATNLWEVPIPTLVKLTDSGTERRAFLALSVTLMKLSSTLIANTSLGNLSVHPIPVNPLVFAIPIAWVVPAPAWTYLIFSPLTKKWLGISIVSSVMSMIVESLPSKLLSKIVSWLCVKLNDLLISLSVPV